MISEILVTVSAGIIGLLGAGHLVLTYVGPKLLPRDRDLVVSMRSTPLVITRQTTLWRAWIGFNASHSLGAILFGLVYGYLALAHPGFLFASPFLLSLGITILAAYVVLAKFYWFVTPLVGAALALISFLAALLVEWVA